MRGGVRQVPALAVAGVALIAALGGTVYAAGKLDGHSIKVKSLPGNRLVPGSLPGNRLKPGAIKGNLMAPGSITGAQVDSATLGQVPSAVHAETAQSARDAETALHSATAQNAKTVNGYKVGCKRGTRPFAGACWEVAASGVALNAPAAAAACANLGGELPDALTLAAFAQQPGIVLASGGEWTSDLTNVSGPNAYAVITVAPNAELNFVSGASNTKQFRCVLPLIG
jgi:hypothetical protein